MGGGGWGNSQQQLLQRRHMLPIVKTYSSLPLQKLLHNQIIAEHLHLNILIAMI